MFLFSRCFILNAQTTALANLSHLSWTWLLMALATGDQTNQSNFFPEKEKFERFTLRCVFYKLATGLLMYESCPADTKPICKKRIGNPSTSHIHISCQGFKKGKERNTAGKSPTQLHYPTNFPTELHQPKLIIVC